MTHLLQPGCQPDPDDAEFVFVAPNGAHVREVQEDGGSWSVIWSDPNDPAEYDNVGEGPDTEWATVMLDSEALFIADDGLYWLNRHLVPAEAKLPASAVAIAKRDYFATRAASCADDMLAALHAAAPADTQKDGPCAGLIGTAQVVAKLAREQADQMKRAWEAQRGACAVTLLDGYFWSAFDQSYAQKHGWELSQFSDGQVIIGADEDAAEPAFAGPQPNMAAHKHVAAVASGNLSHPAPEYVELCRRALKIANESHAARLADDAEEGADA